MLWTECRRSGQQVREVYVGDYDEHYFDLMRQLWAERETFILNEHDLVPWPGAYAELWACGAPLCTIPAPYVYGTEQPYSYGLGLMKYGNFLMKEFPDHLDGGELSHHWTNVDGVLTTRLQEKGVGIHYHSPPVLHLNASRLPIYR